MNIIKIFCLIGVFLMIIYSECTANDPMAGGACEYKTYKGTAKILSITLKKSRKSSERYEVKFSFVSDQENEVESQTEKQKEHILLLSNSNYPGPGFLEKYKIQVGKTFKCHKEVIVTGTCTPVVFNFPTIRLDNNFDK